jgi:hypothetical protein
MTRPTRQSAPGDKIRTILAFCLLGVQCDATRRDATLCCLGPNANIFLKPGFVNTILHFLIFAAAYLIIPYPRPVVIVIHTLPAVATNFLLPHVVHYLLYWSRPKLFSVIWIIAAIFASVTPPNVPSIFRISTVLAFSIPSAAGDISWLGQLRS